MEIHMKNTGHNSSLAPVYFYATSRGRHPGISLGTMSLPRGSGDFKTILKGESLADSSYTLDDIRGIFIPLSEEIMFVSQWDDSEFIRKNFVEPKQVQETTKPQTEVKKCARCFSYVFPRGTGRPVFQFWQILHCVVWFRVHINKDT